MLTNGRPWDRAAAAHFATNRRAAGNGALMRATTSAVHFAGQGRQATMDAARAISALAHVRPEHRGRGVPRRGGRGGADGQ